MVNRARSSAVADDASSSLQSNSNFSSDERMVLDRRFSINGIVKFDGDLQIDGHIDADIQCQRLFISATASVDGVIMAGMVEVYGEMQGEVFADLIILRSTAHVEAELTYRALELDPGSYFEGRSRRSAEPLAEGPSFDLPPETVD